MGYLNTHQKKTWEEKINEFWGKTKKKGSKRIRKSQLKNTAPALKTRDQAWKKRLPTVSFSKLCFKIKNLLFLNIV